MPIQRFVVTLCVTTVLLGCERPAAIKPEPKPRVAWQKGSAEAEQVLAEAGVEPARERRQPAVAVPLEGARITSSRRIELPTSSGSGFLVPSSSSLSSSSFAGPSEAQVMEQVRQTMERSLEVGPTLVVWVVDQSSSAARLTESVLTSVKAMLTQGALASGLSEGKLRVAMHGFAESGTSLLDPPSSTLAEITAAIDAVKATNEGPEALFTAVDEALLKYLSVRTQQGQELLLFVVTDEPGDDLPKLEAAVKTARRAAISIYVLGDSVPLGRAPPQMPARFGEKPTIDPNLTVGLDVFQADLPEFKGGSSFSTEAYDSGLGPWSLERLCRATDGRFFRLRGPAGLPLIDPAIMQQHLPEYVSEAEFEKSLSENRCRAAVVKVAALEALEGMENPRLSFAKGNNEARFTQALNQAQRDPARVEASVNRVYDTLIEAEGDRAKLVGARWQVAYDYALGRTAAIKARVDGYNAMIALLKRGKSFTNASSNTWVLEPADTIETGSAIQKIADKARSLLGRVQQEHAGSPWASMAAAELSTPLGWTWREQ